MAESERRLQESPLSPAFVKVTVIGGGVLGCSSALALAGAGHDVTIIERRNLGSGNSSKAAGILSSFAWNDADYKLIAETRGMIGELISLAMAAGERHARGAWRPTPSIVVGKGDSLPLLDQLQERVERHTEECERMDHRAAGRGFPALRFEPGEEILVAQEDGVVEVGDLTAALRARLESEGVTLRENGGLPALPVSGGRVQGADAVVVAAGVWTSRLLAEVGVRLPLQNYRTQLASLQMPAEDLPIVHDLVQQFYTRPESDASMLAGDGTQLRPFEPDGFNEAADPEFIEHTAARVVRRFEHGGDALVRTGWAGLCVATPDRRPMCGPVPGIDGLFMVTGDNGFGVMRSLALGERLADAVKGRVDPTMDPRRFGANPRLDFAMREGYGAP